MSSEASDDDTTLSPRTTHTCPAIQIVMRQPIPGLDKGLKKSRPGGSKTPTEMTISRPSDNSEMDEDESVETGWM